MVSLVVTVWVVTEVMLPCVKFGTTGTASIGVANSEATPAITICIRALDTLIYGQCGYELTCSHSSRTTSCHRQGTRCCYCTS